MCTPTKCCSYPLNALSFVISFLIKSYTYSYMVSMLHSHLYPVSVSPLHSEIHQTPHSLQTPASCWFVFISPPFLFPVEIRAVSLERAAVTQHCSNQADTHTHTPSPAHCSGQGKWVKWFMYWQCIGQQRPGTPAYFSLACLEVQLMNRSALWRDRREKRAREWAKFILCHRLLTSLRLLSVTLSLFLFTALLLIFHFLPHLSLSSLSLPLPYCNSFYFFY